MFRHASQSQPYLGDMHDLNVCGSPCAGMQSCQRARQSNEVYALPTQYLLQITHRFLPIPKCAQ